MVPITLNKQNIFQWALFGLLEVFRVLKALFTGKGSREKEVTRHIEKNTPKNNPQAVLKAMDAFATSNRFLMNVGVEKGEVLKHVLETSKTTRALELGAYCGYSSVLMGEVLKERGGRLVSIEADPTKAGLAARVADHAGLAETVSFKIGKGKERIPDLKGKFGLVFIDHWKDDYLSDLMSLENRGLLEPDAIIVADNVGIFSSTLGPYLNYVRNSGRFTSKYYPLPMEYNDAIEDGVEVSYWIAQREQLAA